MSVVRCKHWTDCGMANGGCCAAGEYGGLPAVETCLTMCTVYDGPSRGIGDMIAKATRAVGAKPCGGCKERQRKANAKWTFNAGRAEA